MNVSQSGGLFLGMGLRPDSPGSSTIMRGAILENDCKWIYGLTLNAGIIAQMTGALDVIESEHMVIDPSPFQVCNR